MRREIVAKIKRQDFIGMFSLCQGLLFIAFFSLYGVALKKLHPDSPTSLCFIIVSDAHPCKKQVKYFCG